jgi:phosphotransacetylase
MTDHSSQVQVDDRFTKPLLEKLRRHPKRVVFTEGEDARVLRVAERLVREEVVAPILLGDRERIRALADSEGIDMRFINVLDPPRAADFELFCQRFAKTERYRKGIDVEAADFVAKPQYFGALMTQYGQADALVGGNLVLPAVLFRALLHAIMPMPGVKKMFGVTVLVAPHLEHFGRDGLLFLADCGLIPDPDIDDLATIAVETGKLAHHVLGREPRIAMLSHSSHGSSTTEAARRVAAATQLARTKVSEAHVEFRIEGEIQADAALDPKAAEVKLSSSVSRPAADVLVFPNLDAAHISMKLLQHAAGASNYGQLLIGRARPAAQVPRTATEETLFGTALAVAVEAVKFHELHPQGEI